MAAILRYFTHPDILLCDHFRLQAAVFDFSLTITSDSSLLTFVPPCCSSQKYMRIPLKFHVTSICKFRYKYFRFPVRHLISGWVRIELCTRWCCYQQWWFRYPQKQTQQRWIYSHVWYTPFDSMVTKCWHASYLSDNGICTEHFPKWKLLMFV